MTVRNLIDRSRDAFGDALARICKRTSAPPLRPPLDLAQLEDRIMLSASPMVDLLMPTESAPEAADELATIAAPPSPGDASPTSPVQADWKVETQVELVFVDQGVDDYEQLVVDLLRDADPVRHFEVVLLDENRDGLEQISDVLKGYSDLSAIHLVSHGTAGRVSLGNLWLSDLNVDAYAGKIAGWNSSLREGADLLIYGCDLASTEAGRMLTEALGALCDCDVAVSDDDTGHVKYGGDWDLEFASGSIETAVAFSADVQLEWEGKLAGLSVDTTADLVDGDTSSVAALQADKGADGFISLREAILAVNAGAGGDTINVLAGTYTFTAGAANEDAAATGDLDITRDVTIIGAGAATTFIDAAGIDRVFDIGFSSTTTLSGLTIQNGGNVSAGGGLRTVGGGGGSQLTLTDVVVRNNIATSAGAGIDNGGVLTLNQVEIYGNTTAGQGGGIRNTESATLTGVTISGNSADLGGGIAHALGSSGLSLVNVTISGNSATDGGGIFTKKSVDATNLTLVNATSGGGIFLSGGGGDVNLLNSILANNSGGNTNSAVTSLGYNIEDGTAAFTPMTGDQQNVFGLILQLGSLQNNGGFTQTHALLAGSDAIDAGTAAGAPSTDQRGLTRDATPDIGAYESGALSEAVWISTKDNVTGSGTPGITAWDTDTLLEVADPSFSLEPGTTNGSFAAVFDLTNDFGAGIGVELTGLHVVTRSIVLGSPGTTVNLQEGDVLFTVNGGQPTLTSTNSVSMNKSDVARFRPDTPGDYSVGTFEIVLDDPLSGDTNIGGISLVEKNMTIGGQPLTEGDFLLIETKGVDNIVHYFDVTGAGDTTTSGTSSILIDGTDIGIGTANFTSVHLVTDTTIVGGANLSEGEVLISLDKTIATGFAGLAGPVNTQDVVALTVTTAGSNTVATGTIIFEGADINLDTGVESIEAFSLVSASNNAPVNSPPTITSSTTPSVAENQISVLTVTATDPDLPAQTVTLAITGGTDAGSFSINATTGDLTFSTAPDFESPTDADTNNVYQVQVTADDGNGGTDMQLISVTVTNQAIASVTATGSGSVAAGSIYTLNLSADEDATGWTINWGDGTINTVVGNPPSVTHTYNNTGFTNNVLVSATDVDGIYVPGDLLLTSNNTDTLFRFDSTNGSFDAEFANATGLDNPVDIEVGPDGLIYASGFASDAVHRYDVTTGVFIDAFVASGSGGLSAPSRMAWGAGGNLYVTSYNTDEVLRYDGTNGAFIDTFVSAGSGGLNQADAIAFGPDGHLYITSAFDGKVLRYNGTTGAFIDQFATVGSTGFTDLTFGPDGHLYVSNVSANKVQRFDGTTGAHIDDFVTTGSGGINGMAGLKFGGDGDLYVVGFNSDDVYRYDGTTGAFKDVFVPSGSGQNSPINLAFTPAHQVIVTGNIAPTITSNGGGPTAAVNVAENTTAVTTVTAIDAEVPPQVLTYSITGGADSAAFTLNATTGVLTFIAAPDFESPADTNNVYEVQVTADDGNGGTDMQAISVTVTDVNESPTANAGGPHAIKEGDSLALVGTASGDPEGRPLTYDWDLNNDLVYGDVSGATPVVTWATLQSFGIDDDSPFTIGLRVTDDVANTDTTTASLTVSNTAPTLSTTGAASVSDGEVYTLNLSAGDPGNETITSWTINWGDGTIDTVVGNPPSTSHTYNGEGFTYNILASATDEDGTFLQNELLVTSYATGDSLFRYAPTTGDFLQEFATADGLDDPIDVIVGPDGNLYVSGETSDHVLRYDAVTGAFIDEFVTAGAGGLNSPGGLAFGRDGNLYVSSFATDEVLRYNGTTGAFIDAFVTAGSGGLDQSYGLTFGPDGNLYVNSYNNDQVLKYNGTSGAFMGVFVSAGSGGLGAPEQMAFGPDGHFYIASNGTNEVLRYDGTTGAFIDAFVTAGLGGLDQTAGLAFGPEGNLYVSDFQDATILRYNGTTGAFIDEYVSAGSAGLASPVFINFLPQQQVAVTGVNDAPVLADTVVTLGPVAEDAGAPAGAVGTLISALADLNAPAGGQDNVTDPDVSPLTGIAITAADTSNGSWHYSTNNGGSWNALGAVSNASARVLAADANTRIFFQGNLNYEGTIASGLTFRAWDQTDGSSNGTAGVDTTTNGGTTAYSTATDVAAITVTAVNDDPTIMSSSTPAVSENQTSVLTVTATDVDLPPDTITYSITGGADLGLFTLGAANGILAFAAAPDFESPTGADTNNVYEVQVTADDGNGGTDVQLINVTVTDVNDAPVITSSSTPNAGENQTAVLTIATTDEDLPADTLTYTITGGVDSGAFLLNATTGVLTFSAAPDFEVPTDADANNVYKVQVTADDGDGGTDVQLISVTVTDANDAPVITSSSTPSVVENQTAVLTIATTDEDLPADTLTYTITGGVDSGAFLLNATTGVLTFSAAPDFEVPTDADSNNVYKVQVTADDGNGGTDVQLISVTVTDANDAPVITSSSTPSVAEEQTAVLTVTTTDLDVPADTIIYTITGGADSGSFTLNATTGVLTFSAAPDFETPTDSDTNNVYEVQVTADDGSGGTDVQVISVTVTAVNDNTPVFTSSSTPTLAENQTTVQTLAAIDADLPAQTIGFAITGGADGAQFTINLANELVFLSAPDFESPTDANADNVYEVQVTADDGSGGTDVQAISVTITAVNDNTPVFTSSSTPTLAENQTTVQTLAAIDADLPAQTIGFAITGGADGAQFTINLANELVFLSAPDFESPTDANADNVYEVQVTADDGSGGTDVQAISVTITAVNDNTPVFTSSSTPTLAENQTTVQTLAATDADLPAQTIGFAITGGADGAQFTINLANELVFLSAPDFESPTDANADNVYEVQVTADDGSGGTDVQAISVTITAVNDNTPVFTSSSTPTLAENQTTVQTLAATDADLPAQTIGFAITGGADGAQFTINLANELVFLSAPDFESPADANADNVYEVQVTADDGGGGTTAQLISVTITDGNAPPIILSPAASLVAENTTAVITVTATDPDGDPLVFSISGGSDAGKFGIHAVTGALSFMAAPNFELPSDVDADNVYHVDIAVSDGSGASVTTAMAVTVTDANDAPVSTDVGYGMDGNSVLHVAPIGVLAGDLDEDGNPMTAVLVAGPAAGTLSLDADGSFTFTPPIAFDGTLQFSYVANDGTTSGNVATVTIVVNTVVAPPPATAPPAEEPVEEKTPDEEAAPPVESSPPAPTPSPPESAPSATSVPVSDEAVQLGTIVAESEADLTGLEHVQFIGGQIEARTIGIPKVIRAVTSQVAASTEDGVAFVLDTLFWQDLDDLKNHVDRRNAETPVIAGTTAGVSSVVTAGYVLWTIRGGWLVSSLLAQMPAWQLVDPLLILDSLKEDDLLDDEQHDEDKKVEEMFDESARSEQ